MNNKEQAKFMLMQFIKARNETPWVAGWFLYLSEKDNCWMGPRNLIQRLGGMAGNW